MGHFLLAALSSMSRIQPCVEPCTQLYIETYPLGSDGWISFSDYYASNSLRFSPPPTSSEITKLGTLCRTRRQGHIIEGCFRQNSNNNKYNWSTFIILGYSNEALCEHFSDLEYMIQRLPTAFTPHCHRLPTDIICSRPFPRTVSLQRTDGLTVSLSYRPS